MDGRGRPRHPETLTPRQQEVLELVREGMTNRQIAEQLGISPDAAKYHVSEIISRTGTTTREEAARWREERREPATAALDTWRRGPTQRRRPAAGLLSDSSTVGRLRWYPTRRPRTTVLELRCRFNERIAA